LKYVTFGCYIVSPFRHVHSVVKVTVGLVMCACVRARARAREKERERERIQLPQDGFSWDFILVLKSVKKIQV
jgi:hypothetical protein